MLFGTRIIAHYASSMNRLSPQSRLWLTCHTVCNSQTSYSAFTISVMNTLLPLCVCVNCTEIWALGGLFCNPFTSPSLYYYAWVSPLLQACYYPQWTVDVDFCELLLGFSIPSLSLCHHGWLQASRSINPQEKSDSRSGESCDSPADEQEVWRGSSELGGRRH